MGDYPLPDYGPVDSVNRPVRTRMRGGVGAGGEKPPATRLASNAYNFLNSRCLNQLDQILQIIH
jgi:hypothetical protein